MALRQPARNALRLVAKYARSAKPDGPSKGRSARVCVCVCVCVCIHRGTKRKLFFVENDVFVDILQQMNARARMALRQPAPNALRMVPRYARRAKPDGPSKGRSARVCVCVCVHRGSKRKFFLLTMMFVWMFCSEYMHV